MAGGPTKSSPRVSVCIPTIDRPDFLREAIRSVVDQTFADYEIVIGDNSGRPEDQTRIDAVLAEFPGVGFVLRRHPTQLEAAESFNSLIDAARGDLWVCLPDDDRLCPNALARAVEVLDAHPECGLSFADHWIIRADGSRDEDVTRRNTAMFSRQLLREGVYTHDQLFGIVLKQSMCLQTTVFRRSLLAAVRFQPGIFSLDQFLFLRLCGSAEPLNAYYIEERVFEYRVHSSQTTSTTRREALLRDYISLLEKVPYVPRRHARDVQAKLGREYLSLAFVEAERGAFRSARADATRSLRLTRSMRSALGALLVATVPAALPVARRVYGRLAEALRR